MYIVGIDPGKKGGIAVLKTCGELVDMRPMGEAYELAAILRSMQDKVTRCYVEKSQAMPGQGTKSMFTYGTGFGKILGVLETLQISHDLVPPQKWQKKMIPGAEKGTSKKAALMKAKQLWPKESFVLKGCRTPHDGIVDAVLIAEYGRGLHV